MRNRNTTKQFKGDIYIALINAHNIYGIPEAKIKLNEEIINVYTEEEEYSKLKLKLDDLDKYKEKIIVKFDGTKISDGIIDSEGIFNQKIYYANEIISVNKIIGKTEWDK